MHYGFNTTGSSSVENMTKIVGKFHLCWIPGLAAQIMVESISAELYR